MSPARRFGTVTIRRLKKRKSYTGAMVAIGGTIVAIIATAGILAAGEANQFIKECGQVQVQGGLAQQSTDSLSRIVAPGDPGEPGEEGFSTFAKENSWPWIVLLGNQDGSEKASACSEETVRPLCGGTLITKRHVVSVKSWIDFTLNTKHFQHFCI